MSIWSKLKSPSMTPTRCRNHCHARRALPSCNVAAQMLLANRRIWIALALLSAAATAHTQPAPRQPARTAFAFVLLGEGTGGNPVPMVRAVSEGTTACPDLKASSGRTLAAMTPRRRPETGDFSGVLVCEARYPVGESASVSVGDQRIDLP